MTKKNETVAAKIAEIKKLSADKKAAKKLLEQKVNDAWAEYKKYVKEIYRPARKAAYEVIDAAKADAKAERAKRKAEKAAAKPEVKKVVNTKKIGAKTVVEKPTKKVTKKVEAPEKIAAKVTSAKKVTKNVEVKTDDAK